MLSNVIIPQTDKKYQTFRENFPGRKKLASIYRDCANPWAHTTGIPLAEPDPITGRKKYIPKPAPATAVTEKMQAKNWGAAYISNAKFEKHWNGEILLYSTNLPKRDVPFSLHSLDADYLRKPTDEEFADFKSTLENELNISFHWEMSPSGNSHPYFWINKEKNNWKAINNRLRYLQGRIWKIWEEKGWDWIKEIQVKGYCYAIEWRDNIPYATQDGSEKSIFQPALQQFPLSQNGILDASVVPMECLEWDNSLMRRNAPKFNKEKKEKRRPASSTCFRIDSDISSILENATKFADYMPIRIETAGTKNRSIVIRKDIAYWLTVVCIMNEHGDKNESMPARKMESVWNQLYQEGEFDRAYSAERCSAIRVCFANLDLIQYGDRNYWIGYEDKDGEHVTGQAAKWSLSYTLIDVLTGVIDLDAGLIDLGFISEKDSQEQERDSVLTRFNETIRVRNLEYDIIKNWLSVEVILKKRMIGADKILSTWEDFEKMAA